MENTGFNEFRIFYFIYLLNEEDYERKESSSVWGEVLSKEFICYFQDKIRCK